MTGSNAARVLANDNAENAKLLIQKVEKLKAKLAKPNLKFDVLAHSMGGIVARYAAMYGTQEPQNKPVPNWYGAKHFNKIVFRDFSIYSWAK